MSFLCYECSLTAGITPCKKCGQTQKLFSSMNNKIVGGTGFHSQQPKEGQLEIDSSLTSPDQGQQADEQTSLPPPPKKTTVARPKASQGSYSRFFRTDEAYRRHRQIMHSSRVYSVACNFPGCSVVREGGQEALATNSLRNHQLRKHREWARRVSKQDGGTISWRAREEPQGVVRSRDKALQGDVASEAIEVEEVIE
ncbi:hypothetical protein TWF718_003423 [Orbilia javanica]|uniref:Uncharacterized protein n=1 Tax=Orbilia javanica TaxID=47235 RepID=A0AAN8RA40_9PEZI